MGLLKWLKKKKKQSQQSAQQAYKKKVAADRVKKKHKAASTSYDSVRQKASPKVSQPSRTSGGSSSGARSGGGSWSKPSSSWSGGGGTAQHRTSQTQKPEKKSGQTGWQAYVQKTFHTSNEDLQQAYKKGKQLNALGVKAKTDTLTYGDPKKYAATAKKYENEYKKKVADSNKRANAFYLNQGRIRLQQQGYDVSKDEWKSALNKASSIDKKTRSQIDKAAKKYGKQMADEKVGRSGKLKSKQLSSEDYLRLQNASRIGGKLGTASLGDRAEKIGSRTAYSADANKAARISTGFMQGFAPADVLEGSVGKYNKDARGAIEEAKKSTSYNVGYGAGQMAGFLMNGTSGAAKSIVSGGAKAAAKNAGKSTAKKFAKNRLAEMAVESPMNFADALKMSRDENGNIDRKKLAGYMALNTGLTGGMGAITEGAAIKFTQRNANELISLQAKANKGNITAEEGQKLKKLYDKLNNVRKDTARADSGIASEGYRKGKNSEMEGIVERYRPDAENRMRNAKTDKYVKDVAERNRQYVNDRELEARNQDLIDDGGTTLTDSRGNNTPDPTARPEGIKESKKQVKASRKSVYETLNSKTFDKRKFSAAETKEIDDSIDKISNMIHNGDQGGARQEARRIAEKYAVIDKDIDDFYDIHEMPEIAQQIRDAHDFMKDITLHMPQSDGMMRKGSFKDFKENLGDINWRYLKVRKSLNGKNTSYDISELWDELNQAAPDLFPKSITDEISRFKRLAEVSTMKPSDAVMRQPLPDEYIDGVVDEIYGKLSRDIYDSAEANARGFKEPKPKKTSAAGVNTTPVSEMSEEALRKERNSLDYVIRRKGKTPEHQEARIARRNEIDYELRGREQERIDNPPPGMNDIINDPKGVKGIADDDVARRSQLQQMDEKGINQHISGKLDELEYAKKRWGEDSPRAKQLEDEIDEARTIREDVLHEKETGQKTQRTDMPRTKESAEATIDEPRTRFGKAWKSLYRVGVDSFADIERVAKKAGGEQGQNLLAKVNAVRNAKNIAGSWIKDGRSTWERAAGGKSLDEIFKGVKKNPGKRNDFIRYSYLLHNLDRTMPKSDVDNLINLQAALKRGEELLDDDKALFEVLSKRDKPIAGMPRTREETQAAIDELVSKYSKNPDELKEMKEFQKEIVKYADDLLQYKVDAGVVGKQEADTLRETYKNYLPTFTNKEFSGVVKEESNITVDRGLKRARGAALDDELVDLYDQLAQSTRSTMKHCEMNEMLRMLGDLQGVKYGDIDVSLSPDQALENSLFVKPQVGSKKVATFYKDGQAHTVQLTEDMYKGIQEWTGEEKAIVLNNPFIRVTSGPSKVFKALITDYNLLFGVRNGARDLATALTYTKDIKGYIKAYPKALKAVFDHSDPYYKAYVAAGGKYSSLVKQGGAESIGNVIENGKLSPLRWISEANSLIETMPRMQEFISTIDKAGVNPNVAGKEVIDRAMRNANDVTLNFGRTGVLGKALNAGPVPYINPSIQGLDKLVRVFSEAKNEKNIRGLLGLGMKVSTFAVAPSVFNEFMLRNDEDYQQLNTRDKDNNYFIPLGKITGDKDDKGKFIKIPKARELVVAAEPFQYFFRHAQFGDSGGWRQMFRTAIDNVGVVNPLTDNLFSPVLRVAQNKTWFGGEIESAQEQNWATEDRYDETTSLIGIKLGQTALAKELKLSPKKIDNLIDSYTGVIGDYLLPQFTEASRGNPAINQFITDSVFSNKLSTESWEKYFSYDEKINSKKLSDEKKLEAKSEKQALWNKYLDDASHCTRAISDIQSNKNLTKEQKAEMVREVKKAQNEAYKAMRDGKDVGYDPLQSIYNVYRKQGNKKAVGIAMKYAGGVNADAYEAYKATDEYRNMSGTEKAKARKGFLDGVCDIRDIQGRIGDGKYSDKYTDYKTISVSGVMRKASDGFYESYNVRDKVIEYAKLYKKKGYDKDHFIETEKINNKSAKAIGLDYRSKMEDHDRAMTQAQAGRDDGSFYISYKNNPAHQKYRMPAARYLVKTNKKKWTTEEIHKFAEKHEYSYKSDYDDVYEQARKTYKDASDLECAAVAQVITSKGYNDFGDTSQKDDSGIFGDVSSGGKGGRRRRRRRRRGRRRRGHGGGGGGGKVASIDWYDYAKGIFNAENIKASTASSVARTKKIADMDVKDFTHRSELTEAYRRRMRKIQVINRKTKVLK